MNTIEQISTPTGDMGANRALGDEWLSRLPSMALLDAAPSATANRGLRMRHIVATRRAEAARLADRALWSQHTADACWYAGKLRAARQLDAQAARERDLAAWLTAEADALVPV